MILRAAGSTPLRLVVGSFLLLIALSSGLLLLPPATPAGQPIGVVDALFTATSAACVTGLAVRDTGTGFTGFGQLVILLTIQLGGLGVVTFSLVVLVAIRGRFTLLERALVESTLSETASSQDRLRPLLRQMLRFTFIAEALGALVLFFRFWPDLGAKSAAWSAIFHAISAFCNAGFGLWPDSLMRYRGDLVVNSVVAALIVLGGLGFLLVYELETSWRHHRRRPFPRGLWRRLSVHTRLTLVVTVTLIVGATVAFFLLERGGVLGGLPFGEQLLASSFQSITTRTAGFNTVDIAALRPATLLVMMLLMFVGGSPGSCAGGIKTTTFGVLVLLATTRAAGRAHVSAFNRTLSRQSLELTLVIVVVAGFGFVAAVAILLLLDPASSPAAAADRFLPLTFESMSALGTVGLSTGITASLPSLSKLAIVMMMFAGRLGALSLALALAAERPIDDWRYPEESVALG